MDILVFFPLGRLFGALASVAASCLGAAMVDFMRMSLGSLF